jgi:hypothetical protein
MKLLKLFLLTSVFVLIGSFCSANASVLTFDDISTGSVSTYGGFDWLNMYVKNQPNNAVSGKQIAYDGFGLPGGISRNELFDFNSAYLSALSNNSSSLNLTVLGFNISLTPNILSNYSSLTPKYNQTISFNQNTPALFTFNYDDINLLVFIPYDSQSPLTSLGNNKFAMDNFVYNEPIPPTPEPSTMLLGFIGLGGLIGSRKRK